MYKIYVSPSVQENNVGVGEYGTEENMMIDLAVIVIKQLQACGYETKRNAPTMTLAQIVEDSNNFKPDLHLALHSNASNGKARGCEVFCYKFNSSGHVQATAIYNSLATLTPVVDRGVKQGYDAYGKGKPMFEVAYTHSPAVLVEVGFHDNTDDAKWIKGHLEQIAGAIVTGINSYFNISQPPAVDYKQLYEDLEKVHTKMMTDIFELMQKYNK